MSNLVISATIESTDSLTPLAVEIWLDDLLILATDHLTTTKLQHELEDNSEITHSLKFILKNKLSSHTQIDSDGNIIKDALIKIYNLKFDDISMDHMFSQLSKYSHNFNNTGPDTVEPCGGFMGCNGTVTFEFSTPFYLWLLENM
jgi:hypothetical protein